MRGTGHRSVRSCSLRFVNNNFEFSHRLFDIIEQLVSVEILVWLCLLLKLRIIDTAVIKYKSKRKVNRTKR